jgi:hypothetical protein
MPLNPQNQSQFHRLLYAGWNVTLTLLKRDPDMDASQVRSVTLYDCRPARIFKTGEPIQSQMLSSHKRTWHIPRIELTRNGVWYITMLDRFIDPEGRYWQSESTTQITVKLGEIHCCVDCLMTDPPPPQNAIG